jgi:UDP-glucose 4-epimerase
MKSNIYGTHQLDGIEIGKDTVVTIFVDQARQGDSLTVFTPWTQARDFIHIDDVASANEQALAYVCDADPGAETVTIGSGTCHSVRSIAETVHRLAEERLGAAPDIVLVENPRAFETVAEDFTFETEIATDLLGFTSERTVEDAVASMFER